MPLVHFDLELASAEGPVGTKAGCAWDRHCPPCMDGRAPGRWMPVYMMNCFKGFQHAKNRLAVISISVVLMIAQGCV